jgi:hypothetical protein
MSELMHSINPLLMHVRARRQPGRQQVRYGLPCADCRLYYAAELTACPICNCTERISPISALVPATPAF